jgi:hypothetical protein
MKQIQIGNKNHNIDRYIQIAETAMRLGMKLKNHHFEITNYGTSFQEKPW